MIEEKNIKEKFIEKLHKVKIMKMFIILIVCIMCLAIVFALGENLINDTIKLENQFDIPETTTDKLLYEDYQDSLRESDSLRIPNKDNTKYKSHNASTRTLLIENNKYETLIDLKLLTNYKQHVGVGDDTIIARIKLIDFLNLSDNLFEVDSYDVKNNYKSEPKIFTLKYRTDWIEEKSYIKETFDNKTNQSISNETIYYNQPMTNWTEFTRLNELPHKDIEIGIFVDTILGEEIEWVPTIEGFECLEWASYLVTDLVAYYKLDSNNFSDAHGSNDATNVFTTNVTGIINDGRGFSADTQRISIGDLGYETFTGLTFSIWIYPTAYDSDGGVIGQVNGDMSAGINMNTNHIYFWLDDDGSWGPDILITTAKEDVVLNEWNHVCCTWNGTTGIIYVNGDNKNNGLFSGTLYGSTNTYLSTYYALNTRGMPGRMDEFGVWSRALNSTEVTELYNSGDGLAYPFEEEPTDTCTCPGAGENWEVNMSHYCNLTSACTLTTGNLSFIGTSGYFNCSTTLNYTNREALPDTTIFYHRDGCIINKLIILLFISTTMFKRKRKLIITWHK